VHTRKAERVDHDIGTDEELVELGIVGREDAYRLPGIPSAGDVARERVSGGRDDPNDVRPEIAEDARGPRTGIVPEIEHLELLEHPLRHAGNLLCRADATLGALPSRAAASRLN
jgi:hypothetical protein